MCIFITLFNVAISYFIVPEDGNGEKRSTMHITQEIRISKMFREKDNHKDWMSVAEQMGIVGKLESRVKIKNLFLRH